MPASRSRTERWRECLRQIKDRGSGIEIAVASGDRPRSDLVWRVRLLEVGQNEVRVEQASALGRPIDMPVGTGLVAAMAVGQNRWMFRTEVTARAPGADGRPGSLSLRLPESVERCQRRSFFRVATAELHLPMVECWVVLDPASVVAAEVANRAQVLDQSASTDSLILPEVGPRFEAKLLNLGGGGAGLLVERGEIGSVDRSRLIWMRVDLRPCVRVPVGLTARIAHTHMDSSQSLHCGVAFEFAFNPGHRAFVTEQISRYVEMIQTEQADGLRRAG